MKTILPLVVLTILSASVVAKDAGSSTDRSAVEQARIRSEVFVALEGSGSGLQMKAVP